MLKAASANGATQTLRSDQPRSPPCCADPGSCENSLASFEKSSPLCARFRSLRLGLDRGIVLRIATDNRMWRTRRCSGCVKRSGVLVFCSS
jgi:hypothetical protein